MSKRLGFVEGWAAQHARRMAEIERGVRTCTDCGETKPIEEFYQNGFQMREFWKPKFTSQCKVCLRPKVRDRMRKRRERTGAVIDSHEIGRT